MKAATSKLPEQGEQHGCSFVLLQLRAGMCAGEREVARRLILSNKTSTGHFPLNPSSYLCQYNLFSRSMCVYECVCVRALTQPH